MSDKQKPKLRRQYADEMRGAIAWAMAGNYETAGEFLESAEITLSRLYRQAA